MYRIIGEIVFVLMLASILLAAVALMVSRMSLNRNVWLAGSFAEILDYFYLPIKYFFYKFSDPRILDKWMVSLKNIAHRNDFYRTKNRIILAPHCMRSMDCPAHSTEEGIQCVSCGKCIFERLGKDAQKYGYKLYIITGSSFVKHILRNEKIEGALLIACDYELNKVMRALKGTKIVTYGVPMLNDGCYNTQVEYNDLMQAFENFK
ncbi:DUF116 domain-containing protein [Methanomethylovorans sp.]|uniref:DUF116 domain-containing protein n=1 Tax=Methanomethylovorans sp. TaxID=2758717 RepID=UPI00351BF014